MEVIFHKRTPSSAQIPSSWHYLNDILQTQSSFQKEELLIYIITWNIHGKLPSESDLSFIIPSNKQFNFLVIATQECMRSIMQSFINSSKELWHAMVSKHLGNDYHLIDYCDLSAMNILLFAHLSVVKHITNIRKGFIKTGFMNVMANKGAIAISFDYKNKSILFINSHLSSGQENSNERNQDFHRINQMLTLDLNEENIQNKMLFGIGSPIGDGLGINDDEEQEDQQQQFKLLKDKSIAKEEELYNNNNESNLTITDMFDFVFWCGDMNYRITLPQDSIIKALTEKNYSLLLANDQLNNEIMNNRLKLNNFDEGFINFNPTYKYNEGTMEYDYKRIPGWTDRILYKAKKISEILLCKYASIQETMTSDHKPVYAVFKLEINHSNTKINGNNPMLKASISGIVNHNNNPMKTSRNFQQMKQSKTIASPQVAGSASCVIY